MTLEEINRTLVAAEGGCWHEPLRHEKYTLPRWECKNCHDRISIYFYNPDFSQWANFGRLLRLGKAKRIRIEILPTALLVLDMTTLPKEGDRPFSFDEPDQIPLLVATELARILREER